MDTLLHAIVRSSLVVFAALAVATVLRRRSAALRHWVLATGIACGALAPVLRVALPSWNVGLVFQPAAPPPSAQADTATPIRIVQGAPRARAPVTSAASPRPAGHTTRLPVWSVLVGAWLAGTLASLSLLAVALRRVSRIATAATPVSSRRLTVMASDIARAIGLRGPVALLESGQAATPMTWGAARPAVVLPAGARGWPEERVHVVLRHELAHVARGDWLAQVLAEVARAVYWFNPLYWIACRRLRTESERACDDTVLNAGVGAADYASHLLEIARAAAPRADRAAIAMARPSSLEGRVRAMLNARVSRRPLRHVARVATLVAFAAVTVPLAVAQARFSSFSGIVFDQTNRRLPGAVLVLTTTAHQAKYEVITDAAGRFEFAALPAGDYDLAIQLPGFKTLKQKMTVAGADLTSTFQLQIGSLQETVVVTTGGPDLPATAPDPQQLEKNRQRAERARLAAERCAGVVPPDTSGGNVVAVGGSVIPPVKVRDVKPVYPKTLGAAGIAGPVVLAATIGVDGLVRDVTVVSSPDPALAGAAMDAVRQWEFTPTYLNCTPVDISIQVTVAFEAR